MRLGYFPKERIMGQEVFVSIDVSIKPRQNEPIDDVLENTVDYGKILEIIDKTLKDQEMKLIETVVQKVANGLLFYFAKISAIEVTVEKPILPNGISKGAKVSVTETFYRTQEC